jgi:uncharacterized protein with GYD domain
MATFVVLAGFTDQGIRNVKETPVASLRFHRIYAPLGLSSMRSRRARIFGHRRTNVEL